LSRHNCISTTVTVLTLLGLKGWVRGF